MRRQRIGMSQLLLPLILSSLLIATCSATIIPGVPDLSAGINVTVTLPQDGPPNINLPFTAPNPTMLPFTTPIPTLPGTQADANNADPMHPTPPDPVQPTPPDPVQPTPPDPVQPTPPDPVQPTPPDPVQPTPPQDPSLLHTLPTPPQDPWLAREFLHLHNNARRHARLPPFIWDVKLEEYARQYALTRANADCGDLVHSMGPYGENLFWGSGPNWTPKDAVKKWIKEHRFYDSDSNECKDGKMCGHFTQVVWRDSIRLGCAVERCQNNDTFTICSYDPPGNYLGERPYFHYDH